MLFSRKKLELPTAEKALKGREEPMPVPEQHFVLETSLKPDMKGREEVLFGLGCFWGAERKFWQLPGVISTAVGYAAGHTPNPTYEEVCSGMTGHNEVVRVVYDPSVIEFSELLRVFWENHDPTQGMRQGNDRGTQYRSGIYCTSADQLAEAERSRVVYADRIKAEGYGAITTEILQAPPFYYAEAYHQQYLAKNPAGYCGLGGTGVTCPVGIAAES